MKSFSSLLKGRDADNVVQPTSDPVNLRSSERKVFAGPSFTLRVGAKKSLIQLKDLSCGGASGLMEEPVSPGDHVMIELDAKNHVLAEIRWVRRVLVGIRFLEPLSMALVNRVHGKHRP